jgi:hypothetical protein
VKRVGSLKEQYFEVLGNHHQAERKFPRRFVHRIKDIADDGGIDLNF